MRVRLPSAPSIQMNVPATDHNALPPNITPSSSPGTLSTSTLHDCPTLWCGHLSGPSRTRGGFFDFEVAMMGPIRVG